MLNIIETQATMTRSILAITGKALKIVDGFSTRMHKNLNIVDCGEFIAVVGTETVNGETRQVKKFLSNPGKVLRKSLKTGKVSAGTIEFLFSL